MPDAPSPGAAVRAAASDFFFNSWRLVPANVIWGAGLLLLLLTLAGMPLAGPVVAVLLALPTAGIFRLTAMIARQRPAEFGDAMSAWRKFAGPALAIGGAMVGLSLVLGFNVLIGLVNTEPLLWAVGVMAGWGLLAVWAIGLPLWPLVVDPLRDGEPMLPRLRLALAVALVAPGRFVALVLTCAVLLIASTVLFAALVTVTIAFVALVANHYALPAADRLERRPTQPLPS